MPVQLRIHGVFPCGFPHSDIRGSWDICSSPRLFAACHVFRRLPVPRHPPRALSCLTLTLLHSVAVRLTSFHCFYRIALSPFSCFVACFSVPVIQILTSLLLWFSTAFLITSMVMYITMGSHSGCGLGCLHVFT